MTMRSDIVLGIDVGGTFTDLVAVDRVTGGIVATAKLPSTPADPALGAIAGVDRIMARTGQAPSRVFHGTTVGTNALIEREGARTALVTTKGFRDVLALRRQARPRLYDLRPRVSEPLAPRELRFEANERVLHDGTIETALMDEEIERIVSLLRTASVEAVAVSLLHAYANDAHERQLAEAIALALPGVFVTRSSDIAREHREYERTSTTTVNAYIGPAVSRYVSHLDRRLAERGVAGLAITKSNGGLTSAENARRIPVHLIESGPAAGVVATAALGRSEGFSHLIAFDMGGTTAKAGVVANGEPRLAPEFTADRFVDGRDVGGYPILSPVIDIIEIGAGGGSIARLDRAGVVKVGPESAGAIPGPAVYARGGDRPTVTDAHVVLGHIAADGFGSEDLRLRPELAEAAIARHIAEPLGWTVHRAAQGILRLATASMAEMVRLSTLRRGLDPRDFVLVASGGAGPLHATEIAREVGIPKVVVPLHPGLFSAIGAMLGERRHDLVQTSVQRVAAADPDQLQSEFARLEERAQDLVRAERIDHECHWVLERKVDLRFAGQLFQLTIAADGAGALAPAGLETRFRLRHGEVYGYDLPGHEVEIVSLRLIARAPGSVAAAVINPEIQHSRAVRHRRIWSDGSTSMNIQVVARASLRPGATIEGPAIIEDFGATIRVLDGQTALVRNSGVLEIEVGHG